MPGAILVVDDHPLYRDALLQVLRNAFAGYELLVAVSASDARRDVATSFAAGARPSCRRRPPPRPLSAYCGAYWKAS